jgi:Xaa-Pro aminopeptidase
MKEEIINKVKTSLTETAFDAILVFGYDNFQYLSGAYLHFPPSFPERYMAIFWPKNEDPVALLPHEWESSFLNLAWINKTRTYLENPGNPGSIVEAAANLVKNTVRKTGKIGIDIQRTSINLYNRLEETLEEFELVPCDMWLMTLRMIKTRKELELLEKVALKTDHAIAGQAHHVLVKQASGEMNNTEGIRIHAIERELDEVGHQAIAQVTTGENSKKFWPGAPNYGIGYDRVPKQHELMRMELLATQNGYWGNGARMLTLGIPTEKQLERYEGLVTLREAAVQSIVPGATGKKVYEAIKQKATENGIKLIPNLVLGAGVGVTNHEPPYISEAEETELKPGMIMILTPIVKGPNEELMMGKDTIIVKENGAKTVGWYLDWRVPFIANYTY